MLNQFTQLIESAIWHNPTESEELEGSVSLDSELDYNWAYVH